jgi:UDP-glucose 4-epimerase
VNVEGTLNVLLAARDEGVRRVVAASSSSVYGNSGTLPRLESSPPDPESPYGVAKLAAERYCVAFSRVYEIETVVLRYFNVFGPRQDPTSQYAAVVPLFITTVASGEAVRIDGDGYQSRDFTFVENVIDGNLLAADAPDASGAVLNIATGEQTTVLELADTIGDLIGRDVEKEFLPPRTGDVRHSWADVGEARRVIGFEPRVSLRDGLQRAVDWFLEREPVA